MTKNHVDFDYKNWSVGPYALEPLEIERPLGGAVRYHPSDINKYVEQCVRENTSESRESNDE